MRTFKAAVACALCVVALTVREPAGGAGVAVAAQDRVGQPGRHHPARRPRRRLAERVRLRPGGSHRLRRWPVQPGAGPGQDDHVHPAELRRLRQPRPGSCHRSSCRSTGWSARSRRPPTGPRSTSRAPSRRSTASPAGGSSSTTSSTTGSTRPSLPTAANRTVSDLELANGAVIAAGNFTKRLVALDPTPARTPAPSTSRSPGASTRPTRPGSSHIAVSPNGTRLVATGNFATVNGQGRKRAFMLNLGATATLSTWHAPRFDVNCAATHQADQRPGRGLLPRRLLLRDRRHGRTDRYQRGVRRRGPVRDLERQQHGAAHLDQLDRRRHPLQRGGHRTGRVRRRPSTLAGQPQRARTRPVPARCPARASAPSTR